MSFIVTFIKTKLNLFRFNKKWKRRQPLFQLMLIAQFFLQVPKFIVQVPNFIVQVPNFMSQVPNFMFPNHWMALRMLIKSGGHPASPIKHFSVISKLEKRIKIILFMVALKVPGGHRNSTTFYSRFYYSPFFDRTPHIF